MINSKNKLFKYLKEYFDNWLIKDLKKIQKYDDLRFTLPYVLLVCSGIDFLGGLLCGFNTNNSPRRFNKFVKRFMGEVNQLYKEDYMSDFLYNNVRNGASHYSMYKKYVSCSSKKDVYPPEKHLYVDIRLNNDNRVIIQVFQFIDDFIKAYNNFKKDYLEIHHKDAYNKLKDIFKDDKNSEKLIEQLMQNGYTYDHQNSFYSEPSSDSPSIKTFGTSKAPSPSEAAPSDYD